ncbi:MAG: hypothetical protein JWR45_2767 [Blastococcus sp.]|jgi:hypothetical protein|nr:hypothetical protein [Blastococcus sp.]
MESRFGGSSAGLLQRLRPARIGAAELREVADTVLPGLATPQLRIDVVQRSGAGSLVVLEEDERRVRVQLAELADDMSRAGVPPTPVGIADALVAWVDSRPVTDAAAATEGLAVLDWHDRGRTAVGWRVVVRRGDVAVPWAPSGTGAEELIRRTRAAAAGRSGDVALDLRVEGPVALWSHPDVPVLATSALVAPDLMLELITAAGLAVADLHVVVTPHRPVACAGRGIAARLAGETTEASVTLPWSALPALPWIS